MIMSFLKTLVILYCLVFTTHGLARSNEYYQAVVVQALSEECKDACKKNLFEAEIQKSVHELILAIIKELQFQLTQVQKDRPWEKGL
jgi:hypothetical protein